MCEGGPGVTSLLEHGLHSQSLAGEGGICYLAELGVVARMNSVFPLPPSLLGFWQSVWIYIELLSIAMVCFILRTFVPRTLDYTPLLLRVTAHPRIEFFSHFCWKPKKRVEEENPLIQAFIKYHTLLILLDMSFHPNGIIPLIT